jgi:hypothetical protein
MLFAFRHRFMVSVVLAAAFIAVRSDVTAAWPASGESTPVILSVAPDNPAPAKDPQTLRITGTSFLPRLTLMVTTPGGNSIELKGEAIRTQTETSFQVDLLMATAGKYSFVVTNPDGGISAPFALEVRALVKPPSPAIDKVQPEEVNKNQEPQELTIFGRNFGPGLRAIVTDPQGADVVNPTLRDVTPTSFKLTAKLEMAGRYNLVVSNATGTTSNIATIVVK